MRPTTAVPVGAGRAGVAARQVPEATGVAVVTAALVAGAIAVAPRKAFGAARRPVQATTVLVTVATAAVVVAMERPGPRVEAPGRVASPAAVGVA